MHPRPAGRGKALQYFILATAFYLFLGVAYTMPLARHFTDGVPYARQGFAVEPVRQGVHGDHLQLLYRFWLFQDSLAGEAPFFADSYEFSTGENEPRSVAFYFMPYPLLFLAFAIFGKAAGYNAAVIGSYLFGGLGMYLLTLHYTSDRYGSLIAGTVYALAPYRTMAALAGHPVGFSMPLLPFFILAVEKVLKEKSLGWSLFGGLILALLADNDLHVLYLTALITPLFILKHFSAEARDLAGDIKKLVLPALPMAGIGLAAIGYKYSLAPVMKMSGPSPARALGEIRNYSPGLENIMERSNQILPSYAYLGLAACLFILTAMYLLFRRGTAGEKRPVGEMIFFLALLAGSYVLVFGPRFPLSAPYLFLYEHLPKFSLIRQTAKFMTIAVFSLSILVGFGLALLRSRLTGFRGWAAATLLLVCVMADFYPFPGTGTGISILPEKVEAYEQVLRERPAARVLNLPLWPGNDAWSSHYLYYATLYRTVMVNGYSPLPPADFAQQIFFPLRSLNAGQMNRRQYDLLRKMKVEFLILHEESFPPKVSPFPSQFTLENFRASPFLEEEFSAAPVSIFRLVAGDGPMPPPVSPRSSPVGVLLRAHSLRGGEVREDEESYSGSSLRLAGDRESILLARPRTIPAGDYILSVRIRAADRGRFTVTAPSSEDRLLADRVFGGDGEDSYTVVEIPFSLSEAEPVAYRIDREPGTELSLDWIYLRFADREDPPRLFEVEDLFHTGNVRAFPEASGGSALYLGPADPAGAVTRGPYRHFDAGRYELILTIMPEKEAESGRQESVASVIVLGGRRPGDRQRGILMKEQVIESGKIGTQGGFSSFTFPFVLEKPAFPEIEIRHFGNGVYLDKVQIVRIGK